MTKSFEAKTVVIIDDNKSDLIMASQLLKQDGILAKPFDNFELAFSFLKGNIKVDLVLLDIEIGFVNGLDLLKMFKSDPELKKIPVVMMTGRNTIVDLQDALKLGAVDYIVKPIQALNFNLKVGKVLLQKNFTQTKLPSWIQYDIPDGAPSIQISNTCQLVTIGENGLTVSCNFPIEVSKEVFLDTISYKELGIDRVSVKIDSCEKNGNLYFIKGTFINLSPTHLTRIKMYIKKIQTDAITS